MLPSVVKNKGPQRADAPTRFHGKHPRTLSASPHGSRRREYKSRVGGADPSKATGFDKLSGGRANHPLLT